MLITRHLNDDEVRDFLLEGDEQALVQEIAALREQVRAAAERPDIFWKRQEVRIRARIQESERSAWWVKKLAWAGTLAAVLVGGVLINRDTDPVAPQARIDPDHDLLLAVERAMQSGGPASLEPAALLADEMVQNVQPGSAQKGSKKESRNEN